MSNPGELEGAPRGAGLRSMRFNGACIAAVRGVVGQGCGAATVSWRAAADVPPGSARMGAVRVPVCRHGAMRRVLAPRDRSQRQGERPSGVAAEGESRYGNVLPGGVAHVL